MEIVASQARSSPPKTTEGVAGMLRQFISAVESGELMTATPQDAAIVRRLEGTLANLESVGSRRGGGPQR
jgi:hypothetical protein